MRLKTLMHTPPWDWPNGVDKKLLEILGDDDAGQDDRMRAAKMAGDLTVVNDQLVEALLSILQNGAVSEELRGRAAISLGPVLEHADVEEFAELSDVPITENTFRRIMMVFKKLYTDGVVPKAVRRRILEASVRAPQDWHSDAIRAAYASDDVDWKLTAVFSMRWLDGFDDQILEALNSDNEHIHYEAICAAGSWEIDSAWPHVVALFTDVSTDKTLLLAAIEAAANIRPHEAGTILVDLTDAHDEDIVEAAREAMAMAELESGLDSHDDDELIQ